MPGVPRELTEHTLNIDLKFKPVKQFLRRFNEERRKAIGEEVAFEDEHDSRAEKLTFEVVKIKSPYHALFGRPAYAKFMVRPCYVYL